MVMTKEEKSVYNKQQYEKNRQRYRDYYRKNKQEVLARARKWREDNRERSNQIANKSYHKHPEKLKEWRKKNPEKLKKQLDAQKKKFPEKYKARYLSYRIKIEGICVKCNQKKAEEKHHPDYSLPLQVEMLCKPCHREVHHS